MSIMGKTRAPWRKRSLYCALTYATQRMKSANALLATFPTPNSEYLFHEFDQYFCTYVFSMTLIIYNQNSKAAAFF